MEKKISLQYKKMLMSINYDVIVQNLRRYFNFLENIHILVRTQV